MLEIMIDPVPLALDKHGMVRVAGTRITLDTIVGAYRRGDTVAEIIEGFPSLNLADVHAVIAYYLRHQEEVDRYIAENHRAAEEVRRKYEKKYGAPPTLAELEQRRQKLEGARSAL